MATKKKKEKKRKCLSLKKDIHVNMQMNIKTHLYKMNDMRKVRLYKQQMYQTNALTDIYSSV